MKLHPRTMIVQTASGEIQQAIAIITQKHDLSAIEVICICARFLAEYTKYPLRAERHPNHPGKKADEA